MSRMHVDVYLIMSLKKANSKKKKKELSFKLSIKKKKKKRNLLFCSITLCFLLRYWNVGDSFVEPVVFIILTKAILPMSCIES